MKAETDDVGNECEREWNLYVAPHSHTDLTWAGTHEECIDISLKALKSVIEAIRKNPEYKFNTEHTYFVREFIERCSKPEVESLIDAIKRGSIEVSGVYNSFYEDSTFGESVIRQIYLGKLWLKRTLNVDAESIWTIDTPCHIAQMPQILDKSGIKYAVYALDTMPFFTKYYNGPSLLRWKAPDGSAVLASMLLPCYGTSLSLGLRKDYSKEGPYPSIQWFKQAVKWFPDGEYRYFSENPYDPKVLIPAYIDQHKRRFTGNKILVDDGHDWNKADPTLPETVKKLNEELPNILLKVSTASEYFKKVEGDASIPTAMGEMPNYWMMAAYPIAVDVWLETRRAESLLLAAERFYLISGVLDGNDADHLLRSIRRAWEQLLVVPELGFGGWHGEDSDLGKLNKARMASYLAKGTLYTALETISSKVKMDHNKLAVIVFNPLPWKRTDIVSCRIPFIREKFMDFALKDWGGNDVDFQIYHEARNADGSLRSAHIVFVAENVPSIGYKVYYILPKPEEGAEAAPETATFRDGTLENRFYRISFEPESGCILKIEDKELKMHIASPTEYLFNELILLKEDWTKILTNKDWTEVEPDYVKTMWRTREHTAKLSLVENGPVRARVQVKGEMLGSAWKQDVMIYSKVKRIDLTTSIDWEGVEEVQLRQAFPFNMEKSIITYDTPFKAVKIGEELPYVASCFPWGSTRTIHNWISLSDDHYGVTMAPRQTMPFVIEGSSVYPILLRTARSLVDKAYLYTQEGLHTYEFALMAHRGDWRASQSYRLGWEFNHPLIPMTPMTSATGWQRYYTQEREPLLPEQYSFCEVSPSNVVLTALKRAEDGEDAVVRLYEVEGKDTEASIKLFKPIKRAWRASMIEEKMHPIKCRENVLPIGLRAYEINTARLDLGLPGFKKA